MAGCFAKNMPKWQSSGIWFASLYIERGSRIKGGPALRTIYPYKENFMLIRNLEQLEVISEETSVEGGYAYADAYANANANGNYFAATYTNSYTNASSNNYWWWYGSSASSGSNSSSSAY
jgi:hypothetical protein